MARVTLDLPEKFIFTTRLNVRVDDLNYGGHLGNDAVLRLTHEVRLRFLSHFGYSEMDVEGVSLIMSDSVIVFRSEAFYPDELEARITVRDFFATGFDLVYQFYNISRDKEMARLKTGMVCFDYSAKKARPLPEVFRNKMENLLR